MLPCKTTVFAHSNVSIKMGLINIKFHRPLRHGYGSPGMAKWADTCLSLLSLQQQYEALFIDLNFQFSSYSPVTSNNVLLTIKQSFRKNEQTEQLAAS